MAGMFSTADLRALSEYVVLSPTRLTLDLLDSDSDEAIAHIGRHAYSLWTISPSHLGFVVGGLAGPSTMGETAPWVRPVLSLVAALAIISAQASEIDSHLAAIALLVAAQGADAVAGGGYLT